MEVEKEGEKTEGLIESILCETVLILLTFRHMRKHHDSENPEQTHNNIKNSQMTIQ